MATTQSNEPTGLVASNQVDNASGLLSGNTNVATFNAAGAYAEVRNFGFTIPTDHFISSVEITWTGEPFLPDPTAGYTFLLRNGLTSTDLYTTDVVPAGASGDNSIVIPRTTQIFQPADINPNDFRVRVTSSVNGLQMDAMGVVVTYTLEGVYIKDAGTWKYADPYIKDGGVWKTVDAYIKDGGIWKPAR